MADGPKFAFKFRSNFGSMSVLEPRWPFYLEPAGQDIAAFIIHDLRRTASTLLHENGRASDVVEKALNHTIGGVRGVYNRAEYEAQRRDMLQCWADYIEPLMTIGKVILGRFKQVA